MKMDKKKIREEGWLEQYVIGTLDAEKITVLENLLLTDTALRSELEAIELTFEKLSLENTLDAPKHIKAALFQSVKATPTSVSKSIKTKKYNTPFMVAASTAALLMLGCFYLYSEMKGIKENVKIVKEENSQLKQKLDTTTDSLTETNNWFSMITDSNTNKYTLTGNTLAPDAKLTSYINHKTKTVALHKHTLPELDVQHDYQMWADVDGKMINMGVIPRNKELIAMTYIENAESLNITIEPAGGNDHPTVERLISNVYLN